jgi:hypothetical protein
MFYFKYAYFFLFLNFLNRKTDGKGVISNKNTKSNINNNNKYKNIFGSDSGFAFENSEQFFEIASNNRLF